MMSPTQLPACPSCVNALCYLGTSGAAWAADPTQARSLRLAAQHQDDHAIPWLASEPLPNVKLSTSTCMYAYSEGLKVVLHGLGKRQPKHSPDTAGTALGCPVRKSPS